MCRYVALCVLGEYLRDLIRTKNKHIYKLYYLQAAGSIIITQEILYEIATIFLISFITSESSDTHICTYTYRGTYKKIM